MRGLGAYARLAKQSGELLWEVATNVRTPGFENNDISFLIPGSTLFLVWTQSRSDVTDVGYLNFRRDTGALFRAPAENIFLVKFNYWLGL